MKKLLPLNTKFTITYYTKFSNYRLTACLVASWQVIYIRGAFNKFPNFFCMGI